MNHPPGSFPAVYRLKNKAEFDRVFTRPNQRCSEGVLQAIYKVHESLPDNQQEGPKSRLNRAGGSAPAHRVAPDCGARLGLIVAKRFIPLAVHRNHIKRLIREGFRTHRQQLPPVDVIVRIVSKPKHKVTAGEVRALFGKMQRAQRS